VIHRYGIHKGEEAFIFGNEASGMVLFSGCHLRCSFCYTKDISFQTMEDPHMSIPMRDVITALKMQGAKNINLISPSHVWHQIHNDLSDSTLPIVAKISGYESLRVFNQMKESVSVFVPDFKVVHAGYNLPKNYLKVCTKFIEALMHEYGCKGGHMLGKTLAKGFIIRHLILDLKDSARVVARLKEIGFKGALNVTSIRICDKTRKLVRSSKSDIMQSFGSVAQESGMSLYMDGQYVH
jgi:putative pyruvate formate lyase activating enzyme